MTGSSHDGTTMGDAVLVVVVVIVVKCLCREDHVAC